MDEIICKRCGTHATTGESFCGGCGAFLEWEGERVAVPATSNSPSVPTGVPPADYSADAAAPPPARPAEEPATAEPTAAAPELVPIQPVAMQPAPPVERFRPVPAKPAATAAANPDDVVCEECGDPNAKDRRFCRKCGTSLEMPQPAVVTRVPWWKQLFGRSAPPSRPAVARPPRRVRAPGGPGVGRIIARLFAALVVLAVVLFAAVPSLRHKITNAGNHIRNQVNPAYIPVPLQGGAAAGYGGCTNPQLAKNSTVYWYTRSVSDGPQTLTLNVDPSFTAQIVRVAFTPLVADTSAAPSGHASPNPEELAVTTTPAGPTNHIFLANPPKFQVVRVSLTHPTQIQVQLLATDPGAAASTCAETGIVFYSKKL